MIRQMGGSYASTSLLVDLLILVVKNSTEEVVSIGTKVSLI